MLNSFCRTQCHYGKAALIAGNSLFCLRKRCWVSGESPCTMISRGYKDTPLYVIDPSFDSGSEDDNDIVCADCAFYRANQTQFGKCLLMPVDMEFLDMTAPHNDKCEEAKQKKSCINCENLRCAPSVMLIEKTLQDDKAKFTLWAAKEDDYRELVDQYVNEEIDASDIGVFFCMKTGHRRCFTHSPETHVCPDWELSGYVRHKFW